MEVIYLLLGIVIYGPMLIIPLVILGNALGIIGDVFNTPSSKGTSNSGSHPASERWDFPDMG